MRLTSRTRYALVAITDVAIRGTRGPITLSSISKRHSISISYLDMLFGALRRAGLVVSTRGPGGGYTLARSASDITVADIAEAFEQKKTGTPATDHGAMSEQQGAMTHELWLAFNQTVEDFLKSVTLADLVKQALAAGLVSGEKSVSVPAPRRQQALPKRLMPREGVPNSVFELGSVLEMK